MPDNSYRTSNLGPKVSHSTTRAYGATDGHFSVPSWMTYTFEDGSIVDFADVDPIKFSNITTASPTSTFIGDGFLSIVSHSANSMVIAIRSGATTYRWTNDAGGVL